MLNILDPEQNFFSRPFVQDRFRKESPCILMQQMCFDPHGRRAEALAQIRASFSILERSGSVEPPSRTRCCQPRTNRSTEAAYKIGSPGVVCQATAAPGEVRSQLQQNPWGCVGRVKPGLGGGKGTDKAYNARLKSITRCLRFRQSVRRHRSRWTQL